MILNKELFKYKDKKIGIKRFGALGDLIQLLPVLRYLNRLYGIKFTLITQQGYVGIFINETDVFNDVIPLVKFQKVEFDRVIYLDGTLERDHSMTNHENSLHRIKLYEEFFDIKVDYYDFSMHIDNKYFDKAKELLCI